MTRLLIPAITEEGLLYRFSQVGPPNLTLGDYHSTR
jgi:hypothetical protein